MLIASSFSSQFDNCGTPPSVWPTLQTNILVVIKVTQDCTVLRQPTKHTETQNLGRTPTPQARHDSQPASSACLCSRTLTLSAASQCSIERTFCPAGLTDWSVQLEMELIDYVIKQILDFWEILGNISIKLDCLILFY